MKEGIALQMKAFIAQRPPGRPHTACWQFTKSDLVHPVRVKSDRALRSSEDRQGAPQLRGQTGSSTAQRTDRVLRSSEDRQPCASTSSQSEKKVHLPSIEDTASTTTPEDHPKVSRLESLTRAGAWVRNTGLYSNFQSHQSSRTHPSTAESSGPASKVCRFLLSQSLGELPNDNSLDRGSSRESEQNKPSTAPRSLQNRPAGNCPWYIALLHEKEQCLLMLGDEINRLSVFEFEAARKDQMIAVLQEKVAGLSNQLSLAKNEEVITAQAALILRLGGEVSHLRKFEAEILRKDQLIEDLREEIESLKLQHHQWESDFMEQKTDCSDTRHENMEVESAGNESDCPSVSQPESLSESQSASQPKRSNEKLVQELQTLRKNYMISTGTVSSLRRDLSFREADLLKAGSDQDRLQRELTERVAQLHAMSSKFSSLRDGRKHEDVMSELEKESVIQRKQIAELQREESKRNELLAGCKVKIQNLQQELAAERASLAQLQKDRTEIQNKAAALQQSEHQTKVALEQLQSRFERFRGKIIQAAYLAPGAKLLVTEVSDNEILSTMQKIVNDRSEFHQMLIQKGEKVPNLYITETSEKQAKPKSPSKKS
ncbi:coiled-coil domain-containing protein 27-like isoform X1 [Acipenser ruthenus]|uniref:coiled-coil domain-containing protein 27-like isoform X1 n=1 Tax=Acipenser ruthenus TaxID=7906 RepID=UPI002742795C|nr:coiled-coil domain-containing protein 27-like isoform X1 [Acipenser ruthenus]XP_058849084.1 coiled-coil domain-containing protein 27-like isoform X1 [Acipenser ruthenus]